MKKIIEIIAAFAAMTLAASCSKQIENAAPLSQNGGINARMSFSANADFSKVALNGVKTKWVAGDEIGVYQYGYYKDKEGKQAESRRDGTKNIFTAKADGSIIFDGTIANFHPKEEGGEDNRFYAFYPAASVKSCAVTTGKADIIVPATQTGLLSDFGKYAIFTGYLKGEDKYSYDESTQTISVKEPFDMVCITPVLKFSVPEDLKLVKIEIQALDAEKNNIAVAGRRQIRVDAGGSEEVNNDYSLCIENEGQPISGDVYAVLLPVSNVSAGRKFETNADSLHLKLTNSVGATANLKTPVSTISSGEIHKILALPGNDIVKDHWTPGPGIAAISTNGNAGEKIKDDKTGVQPSKIIITSEDETSTIKYKISDISLDKLKDIASYTEYDPESFISRKDINYFEFKVSTEGFSDHTARAITWIPNKNRAFGKDFFEYSFNPNPVVGTTFPEDGSFLYGLKFTYTSKGTNTDTSKNQEKPQMNSYYLALGANSSYCQGSLSIQVPETGRAKLIIHSYQSSERDVNITKNGAAIASFKAAECENANITTSNVTGYFEVTAEDIITIETAKISIIDLTLLWEPAPTAE